MTLQRAPVWALLATLAGCLDPDEPGNLVPRTVIEDPALPRIELNGSVFHAETFGRPENPVVLALHGGPGMDYVSMLPLRALADDGYFVVFWDQRGCGRSQRHDAGLYSYDLVLEDLRQVVDHFTGSASHPMVFIGHSWGAMYATWFINQYGTYGGRIRGAVLSEPGAFTRAQLDAYIKRMGGAIDFFGPSMNDMLWAGRVISPIGHARADYYLALQSAAGWPSDHKDPNNPAPLARPGAVAHAALLDLAERDGFDWTTNLAAFTARVLFLRGELNEANRLEDQQAMAASYPSAEIVTIAGVGHEMLWERPAEYLTDVRTYLGSIGFAGGTP